MSKEKKPEKAAPKAAKHTAKPKPSPKGKVAVLLIRSTMNASPDVRKTLDLLKLRKKHACVVVENTPSNKGMLTTVKDYTAYGEIDEATAKELEKKGKVAHMHPPRGGYEKEGVKKSYVRGGALGYRGGKMTDLIRRML